MSVSATTVEFDKDKYLLAVQNEIRRVFILAGRKFLLATIPKVHIWTGMLRGAFRNAEDLFGQVGVSSSSKSGYRLRPGRKSSTRDTPLRRGFYYTPPDGGKVARTPEAGRSFATPLNQIFTGRLTQSPGYRFTFSYRVNISYYDYLDQTWGSFKAGQEAFVAYVRANLNLPSTAQFHTYKKITVN